MIYKKSLCCKKPANEVVSLICNRFHYVREKKDCIVVYMQLFTFKNRLFEPVAINISMRKSSPECTISYSARPLLLTSVLLVVTNLLFVYSFISCLIGKATFLFCVIAFVFTLIVCGSVLLQICICLERFSNILKNLISH